MNINCFAFNKNSTLVFKDDFEKAINTKTNKDLSDCSRPYVLEHTNNGTSFCRKWSDGFIEQYGKITLTTHTWNKVNLIKKYSNTNYNIKLTSICPTAAGGAPDEQINGTSIKVDSFECYIPGGAGWLLFWCTSGY